MKYIILILPLFVFAFNEKPLLEYTSKKGLSNKSLIIIQDDKVVFEKYFEGNKNTKHLVWSMSKSISSLLFGIAESKKHINKEELISDFFKTKHNYKLIDLLYMASGINWKEVYDKSPFNSDVVRMLYIERKKSVADYILSLNTYPKQEFNYSSGDTNLFMAALASRVPNKLTYPWDYFFTPLGIDAVFEKDAKDVFMGSSYIYLSSDDLVKIAKLLLNKGKFGKHQVVPKAYMKFATSINPYSKLKCSSHMSYGAQFWLNQKCENRIPLKNVPLDAFAMLGYEGQSVFVIPSMKLIAVRLAKDTKKIDLNSYMDLIIKEFR